MRILLTGLVPGLLLIFGMLLTLPWKCLSTLIFGLMIAERIFLLLGALSLLVLVSFYLLLSLLLMVWFGGPQKSMVMLSWSVAVLFCLFQVSCRLFSVLNSGVLLLLCRLTGPCHLGIDNLDVARSIGRLLDFDYLAKPLLLVKDGDLIDLAQYMIRTRGRDTVRVTKVVGHAKDVDVPQGRVRLVDPQGNAEADAAADFRSSSSV